jgi:hypothetical protein
VTKYTAWLLVIVWIGFPVGCTSDNSAPTRTSSVQNSKASPTVDTSVDATGASPSWRPIWATVQSVLLDSLNAEPRWRGFTKSVPTVLRQPALDSLRDVTGGAKIRTNDLHALDLNGDGMKDVLFSGFVIGGGPASAILIQQANGAFEQIAVVHGRITDVRVTSDTNAVHLRVFYSPKGSVAQIIEEHRISLRQPERSAMSSSLITAGWTQPPSPMQCDGTSKRRKLSNPVVVRSAPVIDDTTRRKSPDFAHLPDESSVLQEVKRNGLPSEFGVGTRLAEFKESISVTSYCKEIRAGEMWQFVSSGPSAKPSWHLPFAGSDSSMYGSVQTQWIGWTPSAATAR